MLYMDFYKYYAEVEIFETLNKLFYNIILIKLLKYLFLNVLKPIQQ